MSVARELIVDRIPRVEGTHEHLASWYTQGLSDGLGDRLLMFDNTNAPSWELLRFRPELGAAAGFEIALRDRVERLRRFQHPAFTTVRSVEELGAGDGLALVATYAPGRRLSEAFTRPHEADSVTRLLWQLTPALAALQQQGDDIAHGVLTADRVMVTTDGRLMIREHVLGSALAGLGLSPRRLWADLGVIASASGDSAPRLDRRADVIQLGLIALSLLVGHRVGPDAYPEGIEALFDRLVETADSASSDRFLRLRHWLERALQVNGRVFDCAKDAYRALSDLPDDRQSQDEYLGLLGARTRDVSSEPPALTRRRSRARLSPAPNVNAAADSHEHAIEQFAPERASTVVPPTPRAPQPHAVDAVPHAGPAPSFFERASRFEWIAAAAAAVAIAEALFIGRLVYTRPVPPTPATASVLVDFGRPRADVLIDGRLAGVTPLQLTVDARTRSIRVMDRAPRNDIPAVLLADAENVGSLATAEVRTADALRAAVRPQRSGGVRVSSPFELHVLEHERLLGSSAEGIVVTTAGRHEFDLVNSALGYRARRSVEVKPGQIVALAVTPPTGSVSINALPWADIWIDGKSVGQTPIGNLSVSLGEHEILFRHPELGERREKAMVRSDRLTRVSANLQR